MRLGPLKKEPVLFPPHAAGPLGFGAASFRLVPPRVEAMPSPQSRNSETIVSFCRSRKAL